MFLFPKASRLGSIQPSFLVLHGNSVWALKLTTCLPLLAWIRIHVAVSVLSLMSLLCSIRSRARTTLSLPLQILVSQQIGHVL